MKKKMSKHCTFNWKHAGILIALLLIVPLTNEGTCQTYNLVEGFGKNATGGAGQTVYTVTSSAESGPGSLNNAFQPGDYVSNMIIVFAVDTVTLPGNRYVGSNVTIDGLANGRNGVTMDVPKTAKRGIVIEDPASNIIIRGINFRCNATPGGGGTQFDLLALDGTNGSSISNVLIDQSTFVQATDGALDITGNVSNVTVQRCLFYGNAITMLIKYDSRANLSLHHNVFTRNGERNPQIKGDMQFIDYVNNVVYLNDVPQYPDGSSVDPYGVRIWSAGAGSDSPGNVVGNFVASAFVGYGAWFDVIVDPGASLAGVYIDEAGNYYSPSTHGYPSPKATPNPIPVEFQVTTYTVNELKSKLLPVVGAPNRTVLDQQRIDDVAAVLPGSADDDTTPPDPPTGLHLR
jgi:pectate lyase